MSKSILHILHHTWKVIHTLQKINKSQKKPRIFPSKSYHVTSIYKIRSIKGTFPVYFYIIFLIYCKSACLLVLVTDFPYMSWFSLFDVWKNVIYVENIADITKMFWSTFAFTGVWSECYVCYIYGSINQFIYNL